MAGRCDASCGSATCPLNNYRSLNTGSLQLTLSREYINQDQIQIGSHRSFVGAIGYDHDEVQTINERTNVELQIGLADRLSLMIDVPFVTRQHSHIHHDQGESILETWRFSGIGDAIINAHYHFLPAGTENNPELSFQAGMKLPTGITSAKNQAGEEAEASIQPGSGSTDGIAGIYFRQPLGSVPMINGEFSVLPMIAGMSDQVNGTGTNGWRFGNTVFAYIGTSYQFVDWANFMVQINGRFQDFADAGSTQEPVENTGGTWIFVSPGLRIDLSDYLSATAYVQLPVLQNVHGIQQTSRYNLQMNITFTSNIFHE